MIDTDFDVNKLSPCLINIINTAVDYKGYIYGGFLRDYFAQVLPSDLDIKFNSKYLMVDFLSKIKSVFNCKISFKEKPYSYKIWHHVIVESSSFKGISHLDVIVGDPYAENGDADVNLLMYGCNIKPHMFVYNNLFEKQEIIERITNRQFIPLATCPRFRYNKFILKGWRDGRSPNEIIVTKEKNPHANQLFDDLII